MQWTTLLKRNFFFIRFKERKKKISTHRFTWISKSAALGWCVPSSCPDINPNISSVINLIRVVMCVCLALPLSLPKCLSLVLRQCYLCEFECESLWVFFFDFYLFSFVFFFSFRGFTGLMDVLFLRVFCWFNWLLAFVCVLYFIALWSKYPSVEIWLWAQGFGMYLVYVITY